MTPWFCFLWKGLALCGKKTEFEGEIINSRGDAKNVQDVVGISGGLWKRHGSQSGGVPRGQSQNNLSSK